MMSSVNMDKVRWGNDHDWDKAVMPVLLVECPLLLRLGIRVFGYLRP